LTDITAAAEGGTEFGIGLVVSQTFGVLKRKFWACLLFASIFVLPMLTDRILYRFPASRSLLNYSVSFPGYSSGPYIPEFSFKPYILIFYALQFTLNNMIYAITAYGVFQHLSGRALRIGESLKQGLRRFFPATGIALLVSLMTWGGLGLFVIIARWWYLWWSINSALLVAFLSLILVALGFWAATMFVVSIPVCVVERLGLIESLKRSARLTKGHRWKVFGILALLLIAFLAVGYSMVLLGSLRFAMIRWLIGHWSVTEWLLLALRTNAVMIIGVITATMYAILRRAKDGTNVEGLADVFE